MSPVCLLYLVLLSSSKQASLSALTFRREEEANNVVLVDQLGLGDYRTIQAAIDDIPDGNSIPITVHINEGIFVERVLIPASKPYITLQGAGREVTLITWNLKASDIGPDGQLLTAYQTASVTVFASNFVAKDISFANPQQPPPPGVDGAQAVAFKISGDMAAFYRCGFYGAQDTLCDDQGRHYFEDCFIQGSIDFIFGNGRSIYYNCELNSIARGYGSIAAQDQQSHEDNTGFSFIYCRVTGTGPVYLGRAMGPYSRIIYSYSYFEGIVDPRGWDDWDHDIHKDGTVYFRQYRCSGPGADESGRVAWSAELSDKEAQPFLDTSFIDASEWLDT